MKHKVLNYVNNEAGLFDFWGTSCYDTFVNNQPRILVVEDEEYLRDLYQEVLSDQGYFVDTAKDGNEGLVKIKAGGWDLVMLDIILPGMDGIEIMRVMKTNPPQVPNKKVVFLTNLDKDKEMQEALALGDGYFIKSQITPGNLVDQIKTYIINESALKQIDPNAPPAQTQTQTASQNPSGPVAPPNNPNVPNLPNQPTQNDPSKTQ
ncbi:MAG: response regulator [Candidatus Levybacteria bacterium]|nr:response regulator [Candidatus Levybacteria bacterium]